MTSTTWWNWLRNPPLSLIFAGQETIIGLRVPPKCEATCLVHWNGVFIAQAQAAGKWLKCFGPPSSSMTLMLSCHVYDIIEEGVLVGRAFEAAFRCEPLSPTM